MDIRLGLLLRSRARDGEQRSPICDLQQPSLGICLGSSWTPTKQNSVLTFVDCALSSSGQVILGRCCSAVEAGQHLGGGNFRKQMTLQCMHKSRSSLSGQIVNRRPGDNILKHERTSRELLSAGRWMRLRTGPSFLYDLLWNALHLVVQHLHLCQRQCSVEKSRLTLA